MRIAKIVDDVVRRVVVSNDTAMGVEWLSENLGGVWIEQTGTRDINVGDVYDSDANVFYAPQPFDSWVLSADFQWEAPIPYPTDGLTYEWNEALGDWVEIQEPSA